LRIDGIHNWENIPNTESLKDVQFLKSPHRHEWYIQCFKEVTHTDRDSEFIHLKRDILEFLRNKYWDDDMRSHMFGSMSCEMIGELLCDEFNLSKCIVTEDNENGSVTVRN